MQNKEMVDHPDHYNQGDIECIDAIKSMLGLDHYIAALRFEIIKYTWRILHKENPVQDSKKILWYGERLKEALKEKQIKNLQSEEESLELRG